MISYNSTTIQTVTEITRSIKVLLETGFPFVTVCGEISNLRRPLSGHLYFSLKDAVSQIKAVCFKPQLRYITVVPGDGLEIVCRGRISVYEPRGEYQLVVDYMEARGPGALQLAFERLKKKLAAEGLFAESAKRPLPLLPQRVTLITSPSGAAVKDFLKTAAARFPALPIEILPVRVQGEGAVEDIVGALRIANERRSSDVLVLCRGGGSLEDLWCFNDERVARAVFASEIPVVSAIGHEVDFTIADFVADFRAATPTAAAEKVIPEEARLRRQLAGLESRLTELMTVRLRAGRERTDNLRRILGDPRSLLAHYILRVDYAQDAMGHALGTHLAALKAEVRSRSSRLLQHGPAPKLTFWKRWLAELFQHQRALLALHHQKKKMAFEKSAGILDAVSPLAVLARGYAIVRTDPARQVVRSAARVRVGQRLQVVLQQGGLICDVVEKNDRSR